MDVDSGCSPRRYVADPLSDPVYRGVVSPRAMWARDPGGSAGYK